MICGKWARALGRVALILALLSNTAFAILPTPLSKLTLAWDPSNDPNVVGYRLYRGVDSLAYTSVTDIGNTTAATISGLAQGATYYFAVTAYDSAGLESTFSGEISYTVPQTSPLPYLGRVSISQSLSGLPVLSGTGSPGEIYQVLATQDLSSWQVLGTATVGLNGTYQYFDVAAPLVPGRFYRLRRELSQPVTLPLFSTTKGL